MTMDTCCNAGLQSFYDFKTQTCKSCSGISTIYFATIAIESQKTLIIFALS